MKKQVDEWEKFMHSIVLGEPHTNESIQLSIGLTLAAIVDELKEIKELLKEQNNAD